MKIDKLNLVKPIAKQQLRAQQMKRNRDRDRYREKERGEKGVGKLATHCCCQRLRRIHVASPWRPSSPDRHDMPHSICASCFA